MKQKRGLGQTGGNKVGKERKTMHIQKKGLRRVWMKGEEEEEQK